jgi:hypothetical protein
MPFQPTFSNSDLISYFKENFGTEISSSQFQNAADHFNVQLQSIAKRVKKIPEFKKVTRGKWQLTVAEARKQLEKVVTEERNLIPEVSDSYVPFGNFKDIKKIIQSGIFYPTFITGLSGNGKTFSIEQACAQQKRELIRVNITIETDEDDLIGGFRLVNGATVWHNGPVIEALERGAILLLDEIDLASNKILCLQSILEGNGVFLKKIGRFIKPKAGFNVFATANTKGKGSDDGRFIGTNVLNEAFLERFPVTFEQEYPSVSVETKILQRSGLEDNDFCKRLVDWADIIRKTFNDGGIDELISTRRLVHIANAYKIFNDKAKAIEVCVNRFDDETKDSFMELYDKVDADVDFDKAEDDAYQSDAELIKELNFRS